MAITYQFYCPECKYNEKLYIGNTMMGCLAKKPDVKLASCSSCHKLVGTKNERCPTCDLGVKKWYQFYKKVGLQIIDTRTIDYIDNTSLACPKCGYKPIKSFPLLLSD